MYNLRMKVLVNDNLRDGEIMMPQEMNMKISHLYMNENDFRKLLEYIGKEISRNQKMEKPEKFSEDKKISLGGG